MPEKWTEDLNKYFTKEGIQMWINTWKDNEHHYALGKHKLITTIKYYYTAKMAKFEKTYDTNHWWGYRATRTLTYCWWKCKIE